MGEQYILTIMISKRKNHSNHFLGESLMDLFSLLAKMSMDDSVEVLRELKRVYPKMAVLKRFTLRLGNRNRLVDLNLEPPISVIANDGDVYLVSKTVTVKLRMVNGKVYAYDDMGLLDEVRHDATNGNGYHLPDFIYNLLRNRYYRNFRMAKAIVKKENFRDFIAHVDEEGKTFFYKEEGNKIKVMIPL